jgi:hypothetical protein
MDYAKLLLAAEVRKLALGMTNQEVPKNLTEDERQRLFVEKYRENVSAALDEFQFTAKLIDEIHQAKKP